MPFEEGKVCTDGSENGSKCEVQYMCIHTQF